MGLFTCRHDELSTDAFIIFHNNSCSESGATGTAVSQDGVCLYVLDALSWCPVPDV